MFDKWKSTADEITGLDGLRIQAHCLIAYFHSPLLIPVMWHCGCLLLYCG